MLMMLPFLGPKRLPKPQNTCLQRILKVFRRQNACLECLLGSQTNPNDAPDAGARARARARAPASRASLGLVWEPKRHSKDAPCARGRGGGGKGKSEREGERAAE